MMLSAFAATVVTTMHISFSMPSMPADKRWWGTQEVIAALEDQRDADGPFKKRKDAPEKRPPKHKDLV